MMFEEGKISNVFIRPTGSELLLPAALNAASLTAVDPYDFNGSGGTLMLLDTSLAYTNVDFGTGVITLASPLPFTAEEGDEVLVVPLGETKWAMVELDDGDEGIMAVIGDDRASHIDDGIRDPDERESVIISDDSGRWEVVQVRDERMYIYGDYLDPASMPASGSDGVAPSTSPTPVVTPGYESLFISWEPLTSADLVTYEVYISASTPFTPGPATYLAEVNGSLAVARTDADGVVLSSSTTYYVKIIARDSDGSAPASVEASGSPVKGVTQSEIDAIQTEVDERARVVFNATRPTGLTASDRVTWWMPSSDGYVGEYWDGTAWTVVKVGVGGLGASVVDTAALAANAVQTSNIGDTAITSTKIASESIVAGKIAAGAVIATKIAAGAVETAKLAADAVTAVKISAGAVVADKIDAGAITAVKIAADAVTAAKIKAGEINTVHMVAGSINADRLTSRTITADLIATGQLLTEHISTVGLDADAIKFGTMSGDRITANTITATQIAANAITVTQLKVGDFTNLIRGELNADEWGTISNGGTLTLNTDTTGPYMLVTGGGGTLNSHFQPYSPKDIPCIPGEEYYFEWNAFANYAGYTGGLYGHFQYFKGDGTYISSASFANVLQGNSYAYRGATVTTPTDCKFLRFIPYVTPGGRAVIRYLSLTRKATGNLLVDGAIWGKSFKTNTGFDDIEILPGDSITPSRVLFRSDGPYVDSAAPGSVSGWDYVVTEGGITYDRALTRMQGHKFTASSNIPRVDIITSRARNDGFIGSILELHASGISLYSDGNFIAYINNANGLQVLNGKPISGGSLSVAGNVRTNSDGGTSGGLYDNVWVGGGSTAANINTNGRIIRGASSRRYKKNVLPLPLVLAKQVLSLNPVTFKWLDEAEMGPEVTPGLIAEEVADAGMGLWVTHDKNGVVEGVRYSELVTALIAVAKEQEGRIKALEDRR